MNNLDSIANLIKIEEFYGKLEQLGLHSNESERNKINELLIDKNSNSQMIQIDKIEKIISDLKNDTIMYEEIEDLYKEVVLSSSKCKDKNSQTPIELSKSD